MAVQKSLLTEPQTNLIRGRREFLDKFIASGHLERLQDTGKTTEGNPQFGSFLLIPPPI